MRAVTIALRAIFALAAGFCAFVFLIAPDLSRWLPAATFETHCGIKGAPMPADFLGAWSAYDGSTIEIQPTTWRHRVVFQPLPRSEDGKSFAELAKLYGTASGEIVTCVTFHSEEAIWGSSPTIWLPDWNAPPVPHEPLSKPPYQAIHATYYYPVDDTFRQEGSEYFILIGPDTALDLTGDGDMAPFFTFTRRH